MKEKNLKRDVFTISDEIRYYARGILTNPLVGGELDEYEFELMMEDLVCGTKNRPNLLNLDGRKLRKVFAYGPDCGVEFNYETRTYRIKEGWHVRRQ